MSSCCLPGNSKPGRSRPSVSHSALVSHDDHRNIGPGCGVDRAFEQGVLVHRAKPDTETRQRRVDVRVFDDHLERHPAPDGDVRHAILAGETEEVAASGRHWGLESIEEDLTVDENARSAALGQRDLEPPVFVRYH